MSQAVRASQKARPRRREARPWLFVACIAVLAAAGVAWWVAAARPQGPPPPWMGQQIPEEGREHVPAGSPITYAAHPPASGPHYPAPAPAGVYAQGLLPGYWVHSLEHGYIVLAYKPPVPDSLLAEFNSMVADFPKSRFGNVKLVIVPYPEMLHPFALMAWGWRLEMETFDRGTVLKFYRAHVDRGPEDIP